MVSETSDLLQTPTEETPEGFEWVSVRKAASRTGDTEKTIYNRTKTDHPRFLKSREKDGKTEVLLPKNSDPVQNEKPHATNPIVNLHTRSEAASDLYKKRSEELSEQVENLQNQLLKADEKRESLELDLRNKDARIAALVEERANYKAAAESADLRMADKDKLIGSLERELAELRQNYQNVNNQLQNAQDKIRDGRGTAAPTRVQNPEEDPVFLIKKLAQQVNELKRNQEASATQAESKKQAFSLFGFKISRE